MSDDTFRPQRKPISSEEIGQQTNQPAANIENELNSQANREGGVKFTGKVPEAFKQAVTENRGSSEVANKPSEMRVTGSSKLEELIAGISSKGNMIYEKIVLPSKGKFYD